MEISYDDLFMFTSLGLIFAFLITFVGFFFNGILVIITFRNSNMHSLCNVLIAMQAVADSVMNSCSFMYLYLYLKHKLLLDRHCYYAMFASFYAMNVTVLLMFWIGIDRLLSVKYAVW
ncbi:hypothetical protein L596_024656 [Steinernema carpocapsae]|uniref:G-protein coupled receptors family 1 profile domain-containing protein n=1 Tax=Steinernema carpocapsae TaxID=34508 RepID=A0A4U5M5D8_STECR|nr:hypothetical protein L596_024656 [Steinernema carpocapsae]